MAEICELCTQVLEKMPELTDTTANPGEIYATAIEFHQSYQSLEASLEGGCSICTLVFGQLSEKSIKTAQENKHFKMSVRANNIEIANHFTMVFEFEYGKSLVDNDDVEAPWTDRYARLAQWFAIMITPAEVDDEEDPEEFMESTGDSEAMGYALKWYEECTESHVHCNPTGPLKAPTRLLSLESDPVRLIRSDRLPNLPVYATLSHCWGGANHLRLERHSLLDFEREIPESRLSKTFTEAISIARFLGIDYLWIDSLCIVQDDDEDWRQESVRMSDVYGFSKINISASSAEDGTVGCIFDRDRRHLIQSPSVKLDVSIGQFSGPFEFRPEFDPFELLQKTPLGARAWAFQERFLASRTLHFTRTQLFWECKKVFYCESSPRETHESEDTEKWLKMDSPVLQQWYRSAVPIYSSGKLTFETDKLVAISGVAKWVQAQTGDDYLAGMWRHELEKQLCWCLGDDVAEGHLPSTYLAPSWSWASINAGIEFTILLKYPDEWRDDEMYLCSHVITVEMNLLDPDNPLGQVKGGNLRLGITEMYHCLQDEAADELIAAGNSESEQICSIKPIWDGPASSRHGEVLYCVPIIRYNNKRSEVGRHGDFAIGIVVVQTKRGIKGEFRRVGYYDDTMRGRIRGPASTSVFESSSKDENGFYYITLV